MKILVDTSVWSLALRRKQRGTPPETEELRQLISDRRVRIIGPIRQELLSGIRDEEQCDMLERHLAAFPDLPITSDDYVTAAQYFNRCRAKGIQGSNTDFLVCAVAVCNRLGIFTTDKDFQQFAKHLPITLYNP